MRQIHKVSSGSSGGDRYTRLAGVAVEGVRQIHKVSSGSSVGSETDTQG